MFHIEIKQRSGCFEEIYFSFLGVIGTAFLIKPLLTVVVDDEDESVDEDRTNEQF
ncbi:hypothetical protein KRV43_01705 [Staphylococcus xylosus]|uniref:hypothetical protein n=1 Tax=Staphylococcus xylosus TaxID=1288 RepID=UPI001C3DFCC2|nr:hypothetical protein [Staphylococcus xylosus]MBV5140134.1 hypothetical protein [Staphylococcus xylosus]MBW3124669.1 hypothetical protein [Staphylococcus xylosus]